jgi:hypothetical protein
MICDYENFVPKFIKPLEKELIPMFSYIDGASKIDFDEEIVLVVTSLISRSKVVTPIMKKMFPLYI